MKLIDALKVLGKPSAADAEPLLVYLACGFTPLHLETFLAADLRLRRPNRRIRISSGIFGDLPGNLDRLGAGEADAACVVVEWMDLDPRLGARFVGRLDSLDRLDILDNARRQLDRIRSAMDRLSHAPLVLSLPSLPIRPMSAWPGAVADSFHLKLRAELTELALWAAARPDIRMVSSERLDRLSPASNRWDVGSELSSGFPYTLHHASALADLLGSLLRPAPSKKGLITDLDDTLWEGILGEVGVQGVSWNLDRGGQVHGLYQQMLHALAESGTLIGVASKNNPGLVADALKRPDLLIAADELFPLEIHWGPKSDSIRRILDAWHIAPDSVVFVDDSPMELAEVQSALPEIECIRFPRGEPHLLMPFLERLQDLFGKTVVTEEDALRLSSLRQDAQVRQLRQSARSLDAFLGEARAEITFSYSRDPRDTRTLELVNKTNQFNLNGRRYTESAWSRFLRSAGTRLLTASYRDKYGQLGKIAVVAGREHEAQFVVDSWVMSCRAFSRRIEHQCLARLFERFQVKEIVFDFQPTSRNIHLQDFFAELLGRRPVEPFSLTWAAFEEKRIPLFHSIQELDDEHHGSDRRASAEMF